MKQRCKGGYATLDPRLESLPAFAFHLGPRTRASDSLERVNNKKGYSPENCVWAGKTEQANNRRNTRFLTDESGKKRPLTEWAREKGVSHQLLRSRLAAGWSDHEAIHGRVDSSAGENERWPWPPDYAQDWERDFRRTGGRSHVHRLIFFLAEAEPEVSRWKSTIAYLSKALSDDPDNEELRNRLERLKPKVDAFNALYSKATADLGRIRRERADRDMWQKRYQYDDRRRTETFH
jgi:hypothetical protein